MAAIETTGLIRHDSDMTAVAGHDRAGAEKRTNDDPKDSMTGQR